MDINLTATDAMGFAAAALVLTTFCMRSMLQLRVIAALSNLAFLGYGASAGLAPVILLHALLLPVNAVEVIRLARTELRAAFRRFP